MSSRLVCAILAATVILAAGDMLSRPRPAHAGPVIRPDGAVEFVRPDGSVAARLLVEIAETPEARAMGLMGRLLSDHTAGMLFLFEKAEPQVFWMRNTPTSLDIIFIDAGNRVLNIAAHTTPMSDRTYASAGSARYVVEAMAGFAERFGIREGFTLRWKRFQR
jgi:uncharacterized membrane protein (UPF0127 family)